MRGVWYFVCFFVGVFFVCFGEGSGVLLCFMRVFWCFLGAFCVCLFFGFVCVFWCLLVVLTRTFLGMGLGHPYSFIVSSRAFALHGPRGIRVLQETISPPLSPP